ncbi:glutamate-1-semialdehyde 2,1-aminomutase [Thermotomaculum hydrothermale]|uniref:Glutamate-1-semialdehyde 2,1-aminomutase n=1 Tax=Thermotomaculum hydrothermale TaxID=981385 RepID=A0A7R6PNV2_9BACT|nr:glutamate-1-semialdehyde 2,1-aminomutase [Thermotomaculum hydrothermale]BBB33098.1 glutamate-1-semialdehyde 2,1-aminomutase [Thermotomaculum hydrothermale]
MREKSNNLFQSAVKSIPGGVDSPVRAFKSVGLTPIFIEKALDQFIYDVDGNKYLDFVLTWGPAILGHSNREVIEEIKKVAENGISFGMPSPLEVSLAEKVKRMLPFVDKVRFVNSGTEATMTAIRLARGYTKRDKVLKFNGCYHGHHDALLVQAGSGVATFGIPSTPGIPQDTVKTTLTCEYNDIDCVRKLLSNNDVACVIVEPVAGNMGVVKPEKGFLEGLREICSQTGTLLIFDEVMTGFRIHSQGAYGLFGITPDLATFGKVIGGGMPVGAVGGKKDIMDYLAPEGPVYQAGTLSGNPVAMACGLKTLEIYERDNVFNSIMEKAERFYSNLTELCENTEDISFNYAGTMFTLFFRDKAPKNLIEVNECDFDRFSRFFKFMLDNGVLLPPSQYEANFLSLKHMEEDLNRYIELLKEFLKIEGM